MSVRLLVLLVVGVVAASLAGTVSSAARTGSPSSSPPVSGASATITVKDGLTPSGIAVKPFRVQLTVVGISFPTREGGIEALPGNVFVHITVRVSNLASASRLVPFNGGGFRTMAIGVSHAVPGDGINDDVCVPPALDGLSIDQQVSNQVAALWCIPTASTTESVTLPAHKSKEATFGGEVVSQADAKAENFALIYSPSDAAKPTILPVGPGGVPTTVPN
jgi:hypothetical protein